MTRKQKIALGFGIGLIVLAAILWLIGRMSGTAETGTPTAPGAQTTVPAAGLPSQPSVPGAASVSVQTAVPAAEDKADPRTALISLTKMIAERFGSYSNTSEFQNVLELKPLMTPSMADWADEKAAQLLQQPPSAEYSGTTTRAVSVDVTQFDEAAGKAEATVHTQRRENDAQGNQKVYYQDFKTKFIREGEIWKLDFAVWDKETTAG